PSRGRGSKHGCALSWGGDSGVAPFAGAWIETSPPRNPSRPYWSPPSPGRGSKLASACETPPAPPGRPLRGAWIETSGGKSRGSSPLRGGVARNTRIGGRIDLLAQVAPFAGAWIETRMRHRRMTLARIAGRRVELPGGCERTRGSAFITGGLIGSGCLMELDI